MDNNTSAEIYEILRKQIISGQYTPQQFLVEREIAEAFHVSRAPVRDALMRLSQEGYLMSFPRRGHQVNIVSGTYLMQIQQVRFQLESLGIATIIKNASDEEIRQFKEKLFSDTSGENSDTEPYHTNNTHFHESLARFSGNEVLVSGIHKYLGDCSLAVFQHPEIVHDWSNFHKEIVNAIAERNLHDAQMFLYKDLQLSSFSEEHLVLPL